MRLHPSPMARCVFAFGALAVAAASHAAKPERNYDVQVLRTSYGIPHIQATDWGSLGYGYGYAFAQDNVCVLAREALAAQGRQARFFGAGSGNANLASDWVYRMVNSDARVDAAWASLDEDTRELLTGYASGVNRYLRDTAPAALPADCRSQAWVQPLTGKDALKVLRKLLVRASTGFFVNGLVGATPPAAVAAIEGDVQHASRAAQADDDDDAVAGLDPAALGLPDFSPQRFGSNAVGLGSDFTGGAGALLGNPHFPWIGIERFYAVHLTIPGRYDAMGGSIYGFPLVNIGFNKHVAWSHTVSTARRFVLRQLTIVPSSPTSYLVDGQVVAMQREIVTAELLLGDGSVVPVPHTFWQTQFGPVVVPANTPAALWSTASAYALTDVNLENIRAFRQYREMGQARNLDEFAATLRRHVGLPWVNTVAADSAGNAFYGDLGAMPNVSNAKLDACIKPGFAKLALEPQRIYALDGSTSACNPGTDADAPEPGIFGAGNLPGLMRRDYVQNSNDSYWLANPAARLEGYSRIIGADENRPQGLRTRLGITQILDRQAGSDGLPGAGFSRQWLQDVLYANRHHSAEIMLDGVLQLCATQGHDVSISGLVVNVAQACSVLANWDRRNNVNSVGAHVWTELWRRLSGAPSAGLPAVGNALYAVPFDAGDPVRTPRGLNVANADVVTRTMGELAYTVKFFADNTIPLDRPWGQLHFDTRNGARLPIHGGPGTSGVYNAISPAPLVPGVGHTSILHGTSYVQAVTFTNKGPDARALVTYSQSSDPANPHYADMTALFSNYGWVDLPFAEGDIRRDPNLKVMKLKEKR